MSAGRSPSCCRLRLERTGRWLADQATVARTWRARVVGLLAHRSLPEGAAMVFPACRSIHTLGMRFPIDVMFVDRTWRVVALRSKVNPWRLLGPVWSAWTAIELPTGTLAKAGVRLGDQVAVTLLSDGAAMSWRP